MPPESSAEDKAKTPVDPATATDADSQPAQPDPDAGSNEDKDANAAQPSGADDQDANEPKSVLDAVMAAAKQGEDGASSDSEGSEGAEGKPAEGAGDKAKDGQDPDAEEEDPPPFHKHPRWQKMQQERNDARKRVGELESQLKDVEPYRASHEAVQRLDGFMRDHELTAQEVNDGLQIMALMKSDPAKALEALQPHLEALQTFTGAVLPDDLKSEVDQGYISPERARELAAARNQATMAQNRSDLSVQRARQEANQRQMATVATAVTGWETRWKASDPDYQKKQPLVAREIQAVLVERMQKGTLPTTEAEATALADECRKRVDEQIAGFVPKKPAIVPPEKGGHAVPANPEPKTLKEAMEQGLRQTR